jgi:hypothetical protein
MTRERKRHVGLQRRSFLHFCFTIVVSDPDAMTACVVEAVMDADVRCILSKGWSDRLQVSKEKDQTEEDAEEEKKKKEEEKKKKAEKEKVCSRCSYP